MLRGVSVIRDGKRTGYLSLIPSGDGVYKTPWRQGNTQHIFVRQRRGHKWARWDHTAGIGYTSFVAEYPTLGAAVATVATN